MLPGVSFPSSSDINASVSRALLVVTESDFESIEKMFPGAEIKTIENAGHWLHAEAPEEFYQMVVDFASK